MSKLPKHFFCALKEDFNYVDYSKWERSKWKKGVNTAKPKPEPWALAQRDRKRAKSIPITGQASVTTSPTEINKAWLKSSGRSQIHTSKASSTASSGVSRINTDKSEQDSLNVNDNTETLKLLIKLKRRSVKDLKKHCEDLQQTNQHVARDIDDTDRHSVSCAREFFIQHEKLGNSITALNRWRQQQIKQAKAELKDAMEEAENHISGLQVQLKAVKADLVKAQSEFHTLKTYKDEKYPVKALQITEMKRGLDKLRETQEDEYEDVELLCQKEMTRLEKQFHQKQEEVLSAIAKERVSNIPPVIKLMASHNHTMKKEIDVYKKEIMQLEDINKKLCKSIRELQLSRPNISRKVFQEVFPKSDKCTPDMDVYLSIPREDWLPI